MSETLLIRSRRMVVGDEVLRRPPSFGITGLRRSGTTTCGLTRTAPSTSVTFRCCQGSWTPTCTSTSPGGPSGRGSRRRRGRPSRAGSPRSATCRSTPRPSPPRWTRCGPRPPPLTGSAPSTWRSGAGRCQGTSPSSPGCSTPALSGVKSFLIDSGIAEFPPLSREELRSAMAALAESGAPMVVHAEDPSQVTAPSGASYDSFVASRPPVAERRAIETVISAAAFSGARAHIVHLAAGECAALISSAKAAGIALSAETCPHYLYFAAEEVPQGTPSSSAARPSATRSTGKHCGGPSGTGPSTGSCPITRPARRR